MLRHSIDYLKDDEHPHPPGRLVDRGFWVHGLPRLIPVCRAVGHRPVVDGVGPIGGDRGLAASRWVVCDRCGVRPEPQGSLDPVVWDVGQPYTGAWGPRLADGKEGREALWALKARPVYPPGPWPACPTGTFSGQVILGRGIGGSGLSVGVGCAGSEDTLTASARVHLLGEIYLRTESFGQGLQRRLIPTGYEDREVSVSVDHGSLIWHLWTERNHYSSRLPRWRSGHLKVDPRDLLLGERRYTYSGFVDTARVTVRLPHGDDHTVGLTLVTETFGRARGLKVRRPFVRWESEDGIPVREHSDGGVTSSGVHVTRRSVAAGTWPQEAAAAIATMITQHRTGNGMKANS